MKSSLLNAWRSGTGSWRAEGENWLALRSQRERILMAMILVVIGALLFVALIWRPLAAMRATALSDISKYEAMSARARAFGREPNARPQAAVPAATAITASAGVFGLNIRRLEPDGSRIRVAFDDAEFADLVTWLDRLEREHSLRVLALELDRKPSPGVVAARITLED